MLREFIANEIEFNLRVMKWQRIVIITRGDEGEEMNWRGIVEVKIQRLDGCRFAKKK